MLVRSAFCTDARRTDRAQIPEAMMRDLLLPSERAEYYIEFNVSGLLRGDQASRFAAYAVARQWGWLSVNDIRRLENLPR